ncbi:hypothetical protein [Kitasatospora sp. NPDC057541]|uniref:hypothetical protein n=1 Tax=unclassified Kitasatospora TaxID=2633591 RepID=UPI00369D08F8
MRYRHNRLGLGAVLAAAVVAALTGCSSEPAPPSAAHAADAAAASPSGPASASAGSPTTPTTAGSAGGTSSPTAPAGSPATATTAGSTRDTGLPTTATTTSSPTAPAPGVVRLGPVDVASAFTVASYSYDWQQPKTLDPVERVRPYATDAYLVTLRPTQQAFPARMTAAQETSVATIRTAAVDADAPPSTEYEAFVSVSYAQHLTNHGTPADNGRAWSLHLVQVAGEWRVDAVVATG